MLKYICLICKALLVTVYRHVHKWLLCAQQGMVSRQQIWSPCSVAPLYWQGLVKGFGMAHLLERYKKFITVRAGGYTPFEGVLCIPMSLLCHHPITCI